MRRDDFVRLYPRLFHMAHDGAWASIRQHGLLSTQALLEACEVPEPRRRRLIGGIRTESVAIEHSTFGTVVLRDQKPLDRRALESALLDMTVEEWMQALNSRVFFFVQPERLGSLLGALSYRRHPQTVLTLDTERLLAAYGDRVELCAINSGFARPHSRAARGRSTFLPIERYPHPERDVPRTAPKWDVAELCVVGGVPDVAEYVIRVDRYVNGRAVERLA